MVGDIYGIHGFEEDLKMIRSQLLRELSRNLVAEPTDYMTSLRKNLQMYIDDKSISIASLAEAADISQETLKTLLYGKSGDCKLSTVVALAKALEISVDELVGAGTLSPIVCESIQITRNLPERLVYFVRWAIRYHEKQLMSHKITAKAVNVMIAECTNAGNLVMTNNFDLVDFDYLEDYVRYKVFMGIKIPCNNYMPVLGEGDILLLANDRNPLQNEMIVVVTKGFIKIVRRKEENINGRKTAKYYSIRNGQYLADENTVEDIIGYVVKIVISH